MSSSDEWFGFGKESNHFWCTIVTLAFGVPDPAGNQPSEQMIPMDPHGFVDLCFYKGVFFHWFVDFIRLFITDAPHSKFLVSLLRMVILRWWVWPTTMDIIYTLKKPHILPSNWARTPNSWGWHYHTFQAAYLTMSILSPQKPPPSDRRWHWLTTHNPKSILIELP